MLIDVFFSSGTGCKNKKREKLKASPFYKGMT